MATNNILRRSLLYVPGSSQRMLDKSRDLVADCVAYDLEDSVTPSRKADARILVKNAIDQTLPSGVKERAVRINSVGSGLALGDLTEVLKSPNLSTIVIPKVESASDLHFVNDVISHTLPHSSQNQQRPPISLIALIESAKSIMNLSTICSATPSLSGLIFAAADFSLDLSITQTPSLTEFLYARSAIVTAARAYNLPSTIDLVCTELKDSDVLREECLNGQRMGFNGKQCIHPSQLGVVHEVFAPGGEEVDWAMRVVVADEKAARAGRGAWSLDGKMIDVPVAERAKAIVKKAALCGADVESARRRWKDEEPQ